MEELIALIVLMGLSLLFDKLSKKNSAKQPPKKPVKKHSLFPPFEFEEVREAVEVKEKPVVLDEEEVVVEKMAGPPIVMDPLVAKKKARLEFDYLKYKASEGNRGFKISISNDRLNEAIILKEILDNPRSTNPY